MEELMFAKKKIILNSAINDNKKGVAQITRLDSLTSLQIKINNFIPNSRSTYIFLLKNNGIQQRFIVGDPRNFECDVDIPIDLDKKISCLLIENGAQQVPIFWGGTENKTQTISNFQDKQANVKNYNSSFADDTLQSNSSYTQNSNFSNINEFDTYKVANEPATTNATSKIENYLDTQQSNQIMLDNTQNLQESDKNLQQLQENTQILQDNISLQHASNGVFQNTNCVQDEHNQNSSNNIQPNLQLHKQDPQEALFECDNLENEIDHALASPNYVLECEPNTPQCANCKYKEVFFRQQQMQEASEQLHKIAQMQRMQNDLDATNTQNLQGAVNTTVAQYADFDTLTNEYATVSTPATYTGSGDYKLMEQKINSQLPNVSNLSSTQEQETTTPNSAPLDEKGDTKLSEHNDTPYYYGLIKTQYDEMFQKYPAFEKLSNIIENSKWITVDSTDEPYIMGIIYENSIPQYLCYGVIQDHKQIPPVEIIDSSQWVPFDLNNEMGAGAYIMYQSAESGETLKVEVC